MRRRVLVLAAHCDDAELGAGGLLRESSRAAVWIASAGDPERRAEAERAAAILGHDLYLGELADGLGPRWDRGELIRMIERAVEAFGPGLVAIPPAGDTHQDHAAVRDAALAALRRSPVSIVEYESPSAPAGWGADYFVPLGEETVDAVEGALGSYLSQSSALYLEEGVYTSRARAAGIKIGARYAEPFRVVRVVAPA